MDCAVAEVVKTFRFNLGVRVSQWGCNCVDGCTGCGNRNCVLRVLTLTQRRRTVEYESTEDAQQLNDGSMTIHHGAQHPLAFRARDLDLPLEAEREISIKIANDFVERKKAFQLVYNSYLQAKLILPNPYGLRVTPFHLDQETQIFLALLRGEALCTYSLVVDGKRGLPMESVYPEEVSARRRSGRRLVEITSLADRRKQLRRFIPMLMQISRLMLHYSLNQGFEEILMVVHPKHVWFYERFLGCQIIGPPRTYPEVRDHPALPLSLDVSTVSNRSDLKQFIGDLDNPTELQPQYMTAAEQEYFGAVAGQEPIGASLLAGSA